MEIHQWTNTFCGEFVVCYPKIITVQKRKSGIAILNQIMWQFAIIMSTDKSGCPGSASPCNGLCRSWLAPSGAHALRSREASTLAFLKSSCCRVRKPGLDHKRIRSSMKSETLPSAALSPSCTGEAIYMFWSYLSCQMIAPQDYPDEPSWSTQLREITNQCFYEEARERRHFSEKASLRLGEMYIGREEGRSCYGLNVCVLPKSLCWGPNPCVAVLKDGTFQGISEVKPGHEVAWRKGHAWT